MIEHIHRNFPQFPRYLDDLAADQIVELMSEDYDLAKRVALGRPTLGDCRMVAEFVMTNWAAHALDACEGSMSASAARELNPDDITHFFKIKALYDGLDAAGLI